ncbi:hypothetical protein KKF91_07045, partial [Myxococcota bacterium]|nr:hypothetical protein [Myxococcota bacterium]
ATFFGLHPLKADRPEQRNKSAKRIFSAAERLPQRDESRWGDGRENVRTKERSVSKINQNRSFSSNLYSDINLLSLDIT